MMGERDDRGGARPWQADHPMDQSFVSISMAIGMISHRRSVPRFPGKDRWYLCGQLVLSSSVGAAAQFFVGLIGTTSYAVMQDMAPNSQRLVTNFVDLGGGPMLI